MREDVAAQLDVIGFVAQRVLEHLPDARHLVLPVQRQDHGEERVELRALHDLRDAENRLGEPLFVGRFGQVDAHFQLGHLPGDEGVLLLHARDVGEFGRDLVQIDVQRTDDVQQRVHVDGLFGDMPQRCVLEFGRGQVVFDDVQNRVTHNALGG